MSDADDRKDQTAAKTPLGFEQEVAPADPSLTGRRLFLKLALFGAAASMIPAAAVQAFAAEASSAVDLPYKNTLEFRDQPGTLSDGKGAESIYRVSGSGDLYIDAAGTVFLSNIRATGIHESGTLNVGTISAVQPMASMAGRYDGTGVDASTTVLYSDRDVTQQPATMRIAGNLSKGSGDMAISLGFHRPIGPISDVYVGVSWSKATC
jgi:hypothetical protein